MKVSKSVYCTLLIAFAVIVINSCKKEEALPEPTPAAPSNTLPAGTSYIAPSSQRNNGNAALGEDFIKNGNFAYAGIPTPQFPYSSSTNELGRTGVNAGIPYNYTEVDAFNGVKVVAPNCLSCHKDTALRVGNSVGPDHTTVGECGTCHNINSWAAGNVTGSTSFGSNSVCR